MSEIICDTSPIQYLHQLDLLHVFIALTDGITVPPAVVSELATGRELGVNLPNLEKLDWVTVRRPVSLAALPLITELPILEWQYSSWLVK